MSAPMITIHEYGICGPRCRHDLPDEGQIAVAIAFLRACGQATKTTRRGSYALKHDAEDWSKERGGPNYVSNGAFIEAARRLGYRVVPIADSPNARIGVKLRREPLPAPIAAPIVTLPGVH